MTIFLCWYISDDPETDEFQMNRSGSDEKTQIDLNLDITIDGNKAGGKV